MKIIIFTIFQYLHAPLLVSLKTAVGWVLSFAGTHGAKINVSEKKNYKIINIDTSE